MKKPKPLYKQIEEEQRSLRRSQKKIANARYYQLNSILGNDYAMFYCIVGGRKTGKSYSVTDFLCNQKKKYGDQVKNYWMRISETSTKAMLCNKADKLVDPDLKRKYNLELTTKGMDVFNYGKPFMTVCPLSSFAKLKGVGFYDKDFEGWYNIVLDEFQLEKGEKRTSFNILYNFIGMIENIARTTKSKIRIFLLGNTLEEASTVLKAFNFLPHKFGRFYLKSKRCVIDNLEPTKEYLEDRYGSAAFLLGGDSMSNYTNELIKDQEVIYKGKRPERPTNLIKFGRDREEIFTVWDGKIIKRYNGEGVKKENVIAMRPYLDSYYSKERYQQVIDMFDARAWRFDSLITQSYFSEELKMIRTR